MGPKSRTARRNSLFFRSAPNDTARRPFLLFPFLFFRGESREELTPGPSSSPLPPFFFFFFGSRLVQSVTQSTIRWFSACSQRSPLFPSFFFFFFFPPDDLVAGKNRYVPVWIPGAGAPPSLSFCFAVGGFRAVLGR